MREWRGPARITRSDKALAWIRTAPRTARQIAELLDITINHACTLTYQLRRAGKVAIVGEHPRRYHAL